MASSAYGGEFGDVLGDGVEGEQSDEEGERDDPEDGGGCGRD